MVDLSLPHIALLAGSGFIAGALNAAAGGGSLVSFPALIALGYPPLVANVTNNVAVSPGYIGGVVGYRRGLAGQGRRAVPLMLASVVGSIIGVGLILISPPGAFERVVPFLVLAAVALLAVRPLLTSRLSKASSTTQEEGEARPGIGALLAQTLVAVYGGYFGAALGVALLAVLGVLFDDSLQRLNALKALVQLVVGAVAAVGFGLLAPVAWVAVAIVGPASIVGGEVGARLARRVSERVLRGGIVVYGVLAAVWLFLH